MNLLAIETTGDLADLAIVDDTGVAAALSFRHRMELSRLLVPRIAELLGMARLELTAVDGIAVSLGPGSFTGVRIGVATAKALALALDRPIAGVPTLEALAAAERAAPGDLICPLVEARGGEVYAGLYRSTEDGLVRCASEMLVPVEELETRLGPLSGPPRFTGDVEPYRELLAGRFGEAAVAGVGRTRPRAEVVARLARARFLAGPGDDRMNLAPIYVRPSAAEARWRDSLCPS